ncbi:outer membrane protein assembly factor BamD [Aurantivibrio plasticivorans]
MQVKAFSYLTILSLSALLVLGGCASKEERDQRRAERLRKTERELYETSQRQLRTQQWEAAIQNLQALEENFPFGTYAEQAQLELLFAYYKNYDFDAVIANADRFIRLHPRHRNADYAYYLQGLASFEIRGGGLDRFTSVDASKRDVDAATQAFAYFSQLLSLYPDSPYTADAEKRMIYLRNLMARHQIHVANYYLKRGAYIAAINRGRYVLENFQQTPAVPDALAVVAQGYKLLNMDDLVNSTLAILKENYPQHPAFDADGSFDFQFQSTGERSWIDIATFGLFDKAEPPGFDSREAFNPQYQAK